MLKQSSRLLHWLMLGKSIDGIKAWHKLGIYRLSARINELRNDGYSIEAQWVLGKNQFGEKVKWKKYYLQD